MSRLRLLGALTTRPRRWRYGPEPSQRADLYLPRRPGGGAALPVAVLLHGGSWQVGYGKMVMVGLAADLVRDGWAVWNVEYRRVGGPEKGGWPGTFEDVAAAVDRLGELCRDGGVLLDLNRVAVVGHSSGGQLALWAAARPLLPPGAPGADPRVRCAAAVSLAGVADLTGAYRARPDGPVGAFLGGGPDEWPERYDAADPIRLVPAPVPVLLVHGVQDTTVSVARSRDYAAAARAAGGAVTLVEVPGAAGRHRGPIDPGGAAWGCARAWLAEEVGGGGVESVRLRS